MPGLLEEGRDTAFAVLASDVIYPVGSADDYGPKFFQPYRDYQAPIYAIPGNHDWYEDLAGFMRVFCDDAPPLPPAPAPRPLGRAWLRSLLWHRPRPGDGARLDEARKLRSSPPSGPCSRDRTGRSTRVRYGSSASTPGCSARSTPSRARGCGRCPAIRARRSS